jgi:hypothetical protein
MIRFIDQGLDLVKPDPKARDRYLGLQPFGNNYCRCGKSLRSPLHIEDRFFPDSHWITRENP